MGAQWGLGAQRAKPFVSLVENDGLWNQGKRGSLTGGEVGLTKPIARPDGERQNG